MTIDVDPRALVDAGGRLSGLARPVRDSAALASSRRGGLTAACGDGSLAGSLDGFLSRAGGQVDGLAWAVEQLGKVVQAAGAAYAEADRPTMPPGPPAP
ncbi:MAG TPA: hypothetical protein VKF59_19685 [Candidatus Dormibacteraeota bacterium]|nr:hypothetical protein [Candidatus Dormibacteraeota bacterium]